MKITQAQKIKNQRIIIDSAVKVFSQQGYKNATIKEIAKDSKITEPSIYNYFTNKENLVFGYFDLELQNTIEEIRHNHDFIKLNFGEKFQFFLETILESLEKNRPFIEECFQYVFVKSSIHTSSEILQQKKILTQFMREQLITSQREGTLPSSPLDEFFLGLLWDFYIGIVCYWLKDQSPSFTNTSQLIDKSMGLLDEVLKTNIANKILDILQFFVRNHLFNSLGRFHG